jgi:hypothetical protein
MMIDFGMKATGKVYVSFITIVRPEGVVKKFERYFQKTGGGVNLHTGNKGF